MSRSTLADLEVFYQTRTERAVCIRETEDTPGGQRRSGSGAHCKGRAACMAPEPQKEETENDDE